MRNLKDLFNKMKKSNRIIISISSDIGYSLAKKWLNDGENVYGTYRTKSKKLIELKKLGAKVFKCDLTKKLSINSSIKKFKKIKWDVLVLSAGTQEPIGRFDKINFFDWEKSLKVNFINQLKILHFMMPSRKKSKKLPLVIFFAGGGTNNATLNYSAYTISKIASIKFCELLDAEIKDTRFTILGPGWVKTKIHKQTLKEKKNSGKNYYRTIKHFKNEDFYPMKKVIKCCDWLIKSNRRLISGRNFSAVNDPWESARIIKINKNSNNFKLRRFGNDIFSK